MSRLDALIARKGSDGKTRYTKIGVAFPLKNMSGYSVTFDALPLPDENGQVRVLLMEPKERDASPAPKQTYARDKTTYRAPADMDDAIPF